MLLLLFTGNPPKIYYVIGPSSGWSNPTAAEVKATHLSGGGAATASGNTTAPTITTVDFDFPSPATGLTGATTYKIALVWSDGTNDSNVAVSADFTTTGIIGPLVMGGHLIYLGPLIGGRLAIV